MIIESIIFDLDFFPRPPPSLSIFYLIFFLSFSSSVVIVINKFLTIFSFEAV